MTEGPQSVREASHRSGPSRGSESCGNGCEQGEGDGCRSDGAK